ncbi:MAG: 50S ribosomal protein L9, partial [Candidatus Bipolaricaulia bacterium]
MKVLLIQPVEKLGDIGDVVTVADGYARNFLLPKGLAVEPTGHNLKQYLKFKLAREKELQSREERARALREQLDGLVLKFVREAHGKRLYGSVRKEDIAEAI